MKRFYCAIALLVIICISATLLNNTLERKADELITIADEKTVEEIIGWWEINGKWFDALLHDDLTNPVYINIEKLRENKSNEEYIANIITGAEKIKESIKLSTENIF